MSAQAQITTYVLQPASLEGALEFTWADNWGATPDLNDPANTIQGFTAFVNDGTAADSLGCNALVNGADIAGKIAVVYRGTCEFGLKALNAQDAGAIGVVIINNQGAPVAMGGGANGANVTIPVVMISTDAGASLYNELLAGNVEMLIGSVQGVYEFNLHTSSKLASIPQYSAMPGPLANAINYTVDMGSWVKNFGSSDQSDVTVNCVITQNGTEVYNNTSDAGAVLSGDSAFFALPSFTQATWSGYYEATYTVSSSNADDFPSDDTFGFNFYAGDVFAYGRIDATTLQPRAEQHVRATLDAPSFMACSYFSHPNASGYKVEGIYTSASKSGGASMDGEVLEARIYEWADVFTGWSDATTDNIVLLGLGEYFYEEDLGAQVVYIPFTETFQMEDNKKYLFCSFSPSTDVFLGFGESLDYNRIQAQLDEPIYLMNDNGTWGSFNDATHTTVGAKMVPADVSVNDADRIELTPYPNPTANVLRIPLTGMSGAATLSVFDLSGAVVMTNKVGIGGDQTLTVDLQNLANGTYIFRMDFENGKRSDFRVVVTK
ncbi:MAG: PA domain-containing protein [Flavobacteriales bacterium]